MRLGLGPVGLALSTSVVALSNFVLLLIFMRRKIGRLELRGLLVALIKIAVATGIMCLAAFAADRALELNRYLDLLVSIGAAIIVYGAAARMLGIRQLGELIAVFRFHREVHGEAGQ